MANYKVTSKGYTSFDVTEEEQLIGSLSYKSWFKFNAEIVMANQAYYGVEPTGFWGTTIEVKKEEKVLLTLDMNWSGEIVMQSFIAGAEAGYRVKHKGFFNETFMLTGREGEELLVMKPHIKWKNMNYEYDITTSNTFETLPGKEILLMISLYCANYYMYMMSR